MRVDVIGVCDCAGCVVRFSGFFSPCFSVCRYPFIVNRFLLGFVERCREICTWDWIGVKTRVRLSLDRHDFDIIWTK